MIERARAKAKRAGLDVAFVEGTAQQLPFDDAEFDTVTGTLMLHHLSKPADRISPARRCACLSRAEGCC